MLSTTPVRRSTVAAAAAMLLAVSSPAVAQTDTATAVPPAPMTDTLVQQPVEDNDRDWGWLGLLGLAGLAGLRRRPEHHHTTVVEPRTTVPPRDVPPRP